MSMILRQIQKSPFSQYFPVPDNKSEFSSNESTEDLDELLNDLESEGKGMADGEAGSEDRKGDGEVEKPIFTVEFEEKEGVSTFGFYEPREVVESFVKGVKSKKTYKKVANRVVPVSATLPEKFRVVRRRPENVLEDLASLPIHPPEFTPTKRYTQDRHDEFPIDKRGFLLPEEIKLAEHIVSIHENAFAWDETERGCFSEEYFDPIELPTIEHVPWVLKNIPIPPGIQDEVCGIIKTKIAAGAYEPSGSSYRSRWFCVLKKDGKSLRIVHDLQPLNKVTIRDVATLPFMEDIINNSAGRACYAGLDLMVAFDQRPLAESSRDLTTFQTPFGAFRLTALPMGFTNSMAILQGDVDFIFRDEMPEIVEPYADDCNVKGPRSRYELEDGSYETIQGNPGIRRFFWEHAQNVHRVVHRLEKVGGTFSAKKLLFCVPELEILGHTVNYSGRIPDKSKTQKIASWPVCETPSEVRGFLGTCGLVRIFIKDFAKLARPLVNLTRKGEPWEWEEDQEVAFQALKDAVAKAPILRAIDYRSERAITLSVDSSVIAVGFVLFQDQEKGKRKPCRFGSIAWNERESRYSQAKLELYGLFRAMKSTRLHIIGAKNLVVEVDAKYIKGMLNNPDIMPSASVNRWIAGIKLFTFELRHVPAKDFTGVDGLSRRRRAEDDPAEVEDHDDWIDESYSFALHAARNMEVLVHCPARMPVTPFHCGSEGVQVFSLEGSDNNGDKIPRSPMSEEKDARLKKVQKFLDTMELEEGLTDKQRRIFIEYASRFFTKDGNLWKKDSAGQHKQVPKEASRLEILRQTHDDLGHRGKFAVRTHILTRFWWPALDQDVQWYTRTCHECQLRQLTKVLIPPTVADPVSLFHRVHIDTFLLPTKQTFRYVVHARCALSGYPEVRKLRAEKGTTVGTFIFEELLCRWGAIAEIITDNGPAMLQGLEFLRKRYGINHIKISPYNSRANGVIERRHRDVRDSLVKACKPDLSDWPQVLPSILWADRATVIRGVGYSPFQMVTGVEPRIPLDIVEATWLVDGLDSTDTATLVALRARQFEKREEDLEEMRRRVKASRFKSIQQFEKDYAHRIFDYDFKPGDLVLVRNTRVEQELDRKTKPRYLGPMSIVRRTKGGAYVVAELDGSVLKTKIAAFRVVPYFARYRASIQVSKMDEDEQLNESELELEAGRIPCLPPMDESAYDNEEV